MTKWGTAALLLALVAADVVWAAMGGSTGPIIGAAAYGLIAVLVLRSGDHRAALAAGAIGFALHLGRVALEGVPADRSDFALLIVNMVLPLGVLMLALQGWHTRRAG
jgi:hypothetical protein